MPHPEHWNKFPNMDDVTTRYELDMHMDPGDNPNWLYNVKQNKVFIKVNSVMTLTFTYKPFDATNLFLRAMLVYTSPDDMHLDIKRCANHRETSNNLHTEVPPAHILKCCHPHAKYVGVENQKLFGERLSVVLPLGRPALNEKGEAIESTMWTFLCQNSCTNGMNRKSTAVIFTLENDLYEIIGKQVMRFKVCSCPKRDNQREDPSARTLKREKKAPE
ncbi:Tumor protein 63, partial [Pseudolycoriella hygida]